MGAIRILTTVAKSVHHGLFQDDKVLQQVVHASTAGAFDILTADSDSSYELAWLAGVRTNSDSQHQAAG
jgi:hypothetical protein